MRTLILILALMAMAACAKKGGEALADTIADCFLPCDVTAVDAPDTLTPADAVAAPEAVTP